MSTSFNAEQQQLLSSFSGRIEPVKISFGYGLSLFVVAICMILLPIIYLGIAGAVSYLWVWYAQHGPEIIGAGHGRNAGKGFLLMYIGPLVIGGILVIFMFKPLFVRPPKGAKPFSANPKQDPFLFAFVKKLCDSVGAPVPKRIDLSCEVNASASFRRGMWSMLGNDLVLTIGLPLVAGQNVRQLTGVLAHEFGHFAQGWAMRASYLIRTVNHWFARVVYARDALDEWLVQVANSDIHFAINLILHVARLFVWLTRRVLWILMMIGHLFSSILSRQMEFDADRHAFRLVGKEPFASALRELPVLGAAENGAHQDLQHAWRERRLADDLPQLISANVNQIAPDIKTNIIKEGLEHSGGMYASHPPTRDRIAGGEQAPTIGTFTGSDAPAQVLFNDFGALCREATLTWYRDEAGLQVKSTNLVATKTIVQDYEQQAAAAKIAEKVLGKLWNGGTLFAPAETTDATQVIPDRESFEKELDLNDEKILNLKKEQAFASAGIKKRTSTAEDLKAAQDKRTEYRNLLALAAAHAKLSLAPDTIPEAQQLYACLKKLAEHQVLLDKVREGFLRLAALLEHLDGRQQDETYINHLKSEMKEQRTFVINLREACTAIAYPFEHQQKDMTVGGYLLMKKPGAQELGEIMDGSQQMLRNIFSLHHRILSRLAALGQEAKA